MHRTKEEEVVEESVKRQRVAAFLQPFIHLQKHRRRNMFQKEREADVLADHLQKFVKVKENIVVALQNRLGQGEEEEWMEI